MEREAAEPAEAQQTFNVAHARFFRVLGDPTRLALVQELLGGPHTVSELVRKLDMPQSRVSNHLACLRWCHFVTAERKGRQVVYSIGDARLRQLLRLATHLIGDDQDRLAAAGGIGPEWL